MFMHMYQMHMWILFLYIIQNSIFSFAWSNKINIVIVIKYAFPKLDYFLEFNFSLSVVGYFNK